ncbi:MAG: laccase domain-containing protein [Candidatus Rokubacteria bacterium]|nr:laccase domain-containing protein [Candidatus Rokubacteria bacterium]
MTYAPLVPHGDPPRYFTFPSLTALRVAHATTTRHFDGATPFRDPSGPFRLEGTSGLDDAGIDLSRAAYARQMHGAAVAELTGGGFAGEVDVLATKSPGVPLAIFTADCLAVTLYDADARALVLAHVGWRGTVRGAPQSAVAALERVGGRAGRTLATIAPSIGPCCYEVDEPVIGDFAERYPGRWDRWVASAGPGHWMLDLWTANEELLMSAGVARERIETARLCTACNADLLFSYRKGNRGRLVTVAALP